MEHKQLITMDLIKFYQSKTSIKEAKRQASLHFNKLTTKVVESFEYQTDNGLYTFVRINKISPNGLIIFGQWK